MPEILLHCHTLFSTSPNSTLALIHSQFQLDILLLLGCTHHLEEEKASWHYFSHSLRVTELFCCDQDLVALLSPRPLDVLVLVLLCDPCRRLWQELFCALQPFRRSSHVHVQHKEIAFASHQVEKASLIFIKAIFEEIDAKRSTRIKLTLYSSLKCECVILIR